MYTFNPVPDDKINSALSKLKAFADNKSKVTQNIKFVLHMVGMSCQKWSLCGKWLKFVVKGLPIP